MASPFATVLLALTACLLAGCAAGRFGTLAARRTITPTAELVDVYSLGALLHPGGADAGFSFGWRHTTFIYPRLPGDGEDEGTRWTYGWVPPHRAAPFFLAATGLGAEFNHYPGFTRVHVGYAQDSFTFAARVDESRTVSFRYRPHFPAATRLAMHPLPSADHP